MSLRWRIAIAMAALAAATTITVGIIGYVNTRDRLVEEVDRSLAQAAGSLQFRPDGTIAVPTQGLLDVYVQALDHEGNVSDSTNDTPFAAGSEAAAVVNRPRTSTVQTVDTQYGNMRIHTVGLPAGAVQVARSMAETDSVLSDVRWRTALLVGIVTVVAAALGWVLARSVTGPLVRLTKAATDVEQSGRLDVAVPVAGRDEVGRLGTAFNGMLGALAASQADQQRLVEDAGHELRTPLTSLRTNVAVLRRHPDLDGPTREQVLTDLHLETEELVGLVEEVVALARGVNDDVADRPIVLGDVARAVAGRAERRHGRPVTVHADGSTVTAAYPALERAVSNLVDNAAKFDRSGGPIEIEVVDGSVTVLDRGPGIGAADADQVFERFYRAESARALPGSGLGLSIVRDVAERYGGSVSAADRPGGGAAVGLRIPAAPPPPPTVSS
jgi:two-component system sensor histidine kinase MprB